MREKILEAIYKLRNAMIAVHNAYMYYNMYLINKVYFGCEVMSISTQQEDELKKIYEPVLLRKLRLSEKFPRRILYSRKLVLGVRLLAPRIIVDALALKLYIGHKRANKRIGKII